MADTNDPNNPKPVENVDVNNLPKTETTESKAASQSTPPADLSNFATAVSTFKSGSDSLLGGADALKTGASNLFGGLKDAFGKMSPGAKTATALGGVLGAGYLGGKITDKAGDVPVLGSALKMTGQTGIEAGRLAVTSATGGNVFEQMPQAITNITGASNSPFIQKAGEAAGAAGAAGIKVSDDWANSQKMVARAYMNSGKTIQETLGDSTKSIEAVRQASKIWMQQTGQDMSALNEAMETTTKTYPALLGQMRQSTDIAEQTAAAAKMLSQNYGAAALAGIALKDAQNLATLANTSQKESFNDVNATIATFTERAQGTEGTGALIAENASALMEAFKGSKAPMKDIADQIELVGRKYEALGKQGVKSFNSIQQAQDANRRAMQTVASSSDQFAQALEAVALAGGDLEDVDKYMNEMSIDERMQVNKQAIENISGPMKTREQFKKEGNIEGNFLQSMVIKDRFGLESEKQAQNYATLLTGKGSASDQLGELRETQGASISNFDQALDNSTNYLERFGKALLNTSEASRVMTSPVSSMVGAQVRGGGVAAQNIGIDAAKQIEKMVNSFFSEKDPTKKQELKKQLEEKNPALKEIDNLIELQKQIATNPGDAQKTIQDFFTKKEAESPTQIPPAPAAATSTPIPVMPATTIPTQIPAVPATTPAQIPAPSPTPIFVAPATTPTQTPTAAPAQIPQASNVIKSSTTASQALGAVNKKANESSISIPINPVNAYSMGSNQLFASNTTAAKSLTKGTKNNQNVYSDWNTNTSAMSYSDAAKFATSDGGQLKNTPLPPKVEQPKAVASASSSKATSSASSGNEQLVSSVNNLTAALKEMKQPVKIETTVMLDGKAIGKATKDQMINIATNTASSAQNGGANV
jgi:hypothetical protein